MRVAMVRPEQLAMRQQIPISSGRAGAAGDPNSQVAMEPVPQAVREEDVARKLEEAVRGMNRTAEAVHSEVRFKVHQETHQIIVKVVDGNGQTIREVPPERVLDAYARMARLFGLLLDETA